jgi:hypothetical protein
MTLSVAYLEKANIKRAAEDFNLRYNSAKVIPVPIDSIIESRLKIDIVPMAGLKEGLESGGFISSDFTTIHIDQYIYFNVEVRYRFSLAHEIGHYVLHKDIIGTLRFDSVEDWVEMYDSIDSNDYGKLEFQANHFAGCVLVPDFALKSKFDEALKDILSDIKTAQESGISRETYLESVVSNIARKLAPVFNVSSSCMENRIKNDDNYLKLIP